MAYSTSRFVIALLNIDNNHGIAWWEWLKNRQAEAKYGKLRTFRKGLIRWEK
jgi:hypothetical protein